MKQLKNSMFKCLMKNQRKNTLPKQGVAAFIVHLRDWLQGSQPEQLPESLEQ